jgi:hypothetical protein
MLHSCVMATVQSLNNTGVQCLCAASSHETNALLSFDAVQPCPKGCIVSEAVLLLQDRYGMSGFKVSPHFCIGQTFELAFSELAPANDELQGRDTIRQTESAVEVWQLCWAYQLPSHQYLRLQLMHYSHRIACTHRSQCRSAVAQPLQVVLAVHARSLGLEPKLFHCLLAGAFLRSEGQSFSNTAEVLNSLIQQTARQQ